jgi:hypothetical protein
MPALEADAFIPGLPSSPDATVPRPSATIPRLTVEALDSIPSTFWACSTKAVCFTGATSATSANDSISLASKLRFGIDIMGRAKAGVFATSANCIAPQSQATP